MLAAARVAPYRLFTGGIATFLEALIAQIIAVLLKLLLVCFLVAAFLKTLVAQVLATLLKLLLPGSLIALRLTVLVVGVLVVGVLVLVTLLHVVAVSLVFAPGPIAIPIAVMVVPVIVEWLDVGT